MTVATPFTGDPDDLVVRRWHIDYEIGPQKNCQLGEVEASKLSLEDRMKARWPTFYASGRLRPSLAQAVAS